MPSTKYKEFQIAWKGDDGLWRGDGTIWAESELPLMLKYLSGFVGLDENAEQVPACKIQERDVDHLETEWKVVRNEDLDLHTQRLLKSLGVPGETEYRLQRQTTSNALGAWRDFDPKKA